MRTPTRLGLALAITLTLCPQLFAQDGIWQTYNRANSQINADSVVAIAFDANDGVWCATRYGAQSFISGIWTDYIDLTKIPSNDIWEIANANGTMYFATRTSLTAYDGNTWTSYTTSNSGLVNAPVVRLEPDMAGNLWIGTARGLNSLSSGHVFTTYKHATVPAMPNDGIQDIAAGPNGDIWLVYIGVKGITQFPLGYAGTARLFNQDTIANVPKDYIMCLAVDHSGNLWAGMKSKGVVRINAAGATLFNRANTPAIRNDTINKIVVDECGNVWIATYRGTAMYDGSTWTTVPTDAAHVPNDTVVTLAVDGRGHIWFGSYDGLTVFKPLPKQTSLISPLMNMTMNEDSVLCRWVWNCPGIIKYWYEIADNPNFTNSKIDTTSPSLTASASYMERGLPNNSTWYWRVKAKNDAGWGPFSPTWVFYVSYPDGVAMMDQAGMRCTLDQNYPNPCSDHTTFRFTMPTHEKMTLAIYDVLGRECMIATDGMMGPGSFSVPVDVTGLPQNGVYFCRLTAGGSMTQRMMHVIR